MRKERVLEWVKLTSGSRRATNEPAIRVRDLPGARKLEDKLFLYTSMSGVLPPEIEDMVLTFCQATFGLNPADTKFQWPDEYWDYEEDSPERWRIERRRAAHEARFETTRLSHAEAMVVLKRLGLDFSDDRGEPLRCTPHLSRAAEAAAKGIAGKMPDRAAANLASWEDQVRAEAERFARKKRDRGRR